MAGDVLPLVGRGLVVLLPVDVKEEAEDGGGEEEEGEGEEEAQYREVRWIVEIVGIRSRLWRKLILRRQNRHG